MGAWLLGWRKQYLVLYAIKKQERTKYEVEIVNSNLGYYHVLRLQ